MRLLVIADVHGNLAALEAVLADPHDAVICLGDLVGYGPEPAACVQRVLSEAEVVVRGNHDHSLATGAAPGAPPSLEWLAEATLKLGASQLPAVERAALGDLPLSASRTYDGVHYHLVHAAPGDPLYGSLEAASEGWAGELRGIGSEVLLVGHTHRQFRHQVNGHTILSPGSVGQPRDGDPRAAYLVIEDGTVSFCRAAYRVERTVAALDRSGIEAAAAAILGQLLRTGEPSLFLLPQASGGFRSEFESPALYRARSFRLSGSRTRKTAPP
jgi:predicted phosphodiesterase